MERSIYTSKLTIRKIQICFVSSQLVVLLLDFVTQTPIELFTKTQAPVETKTKYVSESVANCAYN